jgi:hypothetical protein
MLYLIEGLFSDNIDLNSVNETFESPSISASRIISRASSKVIFSPNLISTSFNSYSSIKPSPFLSNS